MLQLAGPPAVQHKKSIQQLRVDADSAGVLDLEAARPSRRPTATAANADISKEVRGDCERLPVLPLNDNYF
jgi:hypothetical protein